MEKEIKLRIQIQPKDMHHFLVQQNYRSFSGIFGVICSLAALVFLLLTYSSNTQSKNIILILIAALFLVVQPLQLKLVSIQKVQTVPSFKEPLEYTLCEQGIKVQQKEEEAQMTWEDVRKIRETKKSIFIYTSPVSAFILPKEQYKEQLKTVKDIIKVHVKEDKCQWKKN
ncbi:MAG: YcxB family protein [Clostridium sp.]|nr:YcxB family protein [Clostridium sp.]